MNQHPTAAAAADNGDAGNGGNHGNDSTNGATGTTGTTGDDAGAGQPVRAADERERLAEATLESIGDGVIATDPHGATRYMNRAAERLTGWARQPAAGRDVGEVLPLVDEISGRPLEHVVYKCLLKREAVGASARAMLVARDGRRVAVDDVAAPIRRGDGEILGAVVVFRDVTHQRAASRQLSWRAGHDAATGLCNRRAFERQLAHALRASKQDDHTHALLHLELDRVEPLNQTAGHAAGDALLRALAARLRQRMRASDVLARLGGDDLGVLLVCCRPDQARLIAEDLRQAVRDFRFVWDRHSFEVGASVGMVEISADSKAVGDLLDAADTACRMAADQGGNRIHAYAESEAASGAAPWLPRLQDALRRDRFALYAMPIAGLGGGPARHEEILLRLRDDDGAVLAPGRFLPAAARYHLLPLLDRWVIQALCRHLAAAPVNGAPALLSVNLSAPSLNDEALHQFITDQLAEHRIDPARLCFEIGEAAAIGDLPAARALMARLKLLGCRVALDDFGAGLSSFGYLRALPLDFVKIDGCLIRDIARDPVRHAMVEAIRKVARALGVQTIAEHVGDAATLDALHNLGIDFAQGHAVGRARALGPG